MARIRRASSVPDLSPATVAILLGGWGAEAPEPSPHGFGGGMLELYDPNCAGFIRFWRDHEPWLRAQAAAWGWLPEYEVDGQKLFYAEYVIRTGHDG